MKPIATAAALVAASLLAAGPANAQERYGSRPPVVLSPDLAAPWVMQLKPRQRIVTRQVRVATPPTTTRRSLFQRRPQPLPQARSVTRQRAQPVALRSPANPKPKPRQMNPIFLPQTVAYHGAEQPGTIVIDTRDRFLYLVGSNGSARRYGVGVGKPGFEWAGTHKVTRKAEWPSWRPPASMIAREKAKGHFLPAYMEGGPSNPLGARALYLGSTLYRIHGTNAPWTIGQAVSSGCIRMRNEDVMDLYTRVPVGAKVIVR
ncbi:L,D-transpeptidase [Oricola sp.]|uniref:L,D-transpeptidase n=1 Tax=Oricola sp. TaxID=1979950 RepID=UPI003BAAC74F